MASVHQGGEVMNKDCFAYKYNNCSILTEKLCENGGKCSFYKTQEQFKLDVERANKLNERKRGNGCEKEN